MKIFLIEILRDFWRFFNLQNLNLLWKNLQFSSAAGNSNRALFKKNLNLS